MSGRIEVPGADCEEFACVWMESTMEWLVLFPNGYVLRGETPWGGSGAASGAAMRLLGRGECAWFVETGGSGAYVSHKREDDELWELGNFTEHQEGADDTVRQAIDIGMRKLNEAVGKVGPPLVGEKPFSELRETVIGETLYQMYMDAQKCNAERILVEGAADWWVDMNRAIADKYLALMVALESGEILITKNEEGGK